VGGCAAWMPHHFCSRCPVHWHRGWAWRGGGPHDTVTTGPARGVVGVHLAFGMACCPGRGWAQRRRGGPVRWGVRGGAASQRQPNPTRLPAMAARSVGGASGPWPPCGAEQRGRDAASQPRGQKTNPLKRGGRRGCVGVRGLLPACMVRLPGKTPTRVPASWCGLRRRGRCAALVRSGCAVCGPRLPAFGVSAGLLILGLAVLAALVRPRGGHPRCTKSPPLCTIQNHSIKVAQSLKWCAASFLEHRIRTETIEPPTVTVGNFGVMMIKTLGQQHPEAGPFRCC
jgi:hypothetical protein